MTTLAGLVLVEHPEVRAAVAQGRQGESPKLDAWIREAQCHLKHYSTQKKALASLEARSSLRGAWHSKMYHMPTTGKVVLFFVSIASRTR